MKKTGSVAAALLLASSLAACNSSADKTPSSSASAEPTSTVTGESSSTVAAAQSASELPRKSANPDIPRECEVIFGLLEEGDVVNGMDLWPCTAAAHAQLTSLHIDKVFNRSEGLHIEGSAARAGDGFDVDFNADGTTLRGVGGRYWINWAEGGGWQEYPADHWQLELMLNQVEVDDAFYKGGDSSFRIYPELIASQLPDGKWKFEHVNDDPSFRTWFIVDQDYRMTETGWDKDGIDTTRFSRFNEPVSIEPPM